MKPDQNPLYDTTGAEKGCAFLGKPEKTPKPGVYALRKPAKAGLRYFFLCPVCRKPVVFNASESGFMRKDCGSCSSSSTIVKVVSPEAKEEQRVKTQRVKSSSRNQVNGKIVWGGLLFRKKYVLKEGENWIGRLDKEDRSEIMVNDEFMSRRSACVEVIRKNGEYVFKFSVVRAYNPVKVNGKTLREGQVVYLNYEDYIVMGATTLFFKKAKK